MSRPGTSQFILGNAVVAGVHLEVQAAWRLPQAAVYPVGTNGLRAHHSGPPDAPSCSFCSPDPQMREVSQIEKFPWLTGAALGRWASCSRGTLLMGKPGVTVAAS